MNELSRTSERVSSQASATREVLWDNVLTLGASPFGATAHRKAVQALIDYEIAAERDAHAEVVRAAREVDAIAHEEVLDLPLEHAVKRWRNRMEQAHERLRVALAPFMTTEEAP